jgi:hypothetical protein
MKIYSKKFIWSRSRVRKLIHMKKIGHRNYKAISKQIGCSISSAQEKYSKISF